MQSLLGSSEGFVKSLVWLSFELKSFFFFEGRHALFESVIRLITQQKCPCIYETGKKVAFTAKLRKAIKKTWN